LRYLEVPLGFPTIGASEAILAHEVQLVNIYININYGIFSPWLGDSEAAAPPIDEDSSGMRRMTLKARESAAKLERPRETI
jgi:hypothetical protein